MRSIVRDIYIKLPRYRFFDSPYPKSHGEDPKYMQRSRVEGQLWARLTNSNRSGSILVSGYRGVGKTSMVRKVLRDLNDLNRKETAIQARTRIGKHLKYELARRYPKQKVENPKYIVTEVNLAQDDLDVRTILRVMATELQRTLIRLDDRPVSQRNRRLWRNRWLFALAVTVGAWLLFPFILHPGATWDLLSLITSTRLEPPDWLSWNFRESLNDWSSFLLHYAAPPLLGGLAYRYARRSQRIRDPYYLQHSLDHICDRLQLLIERITAEVDEEHQSGVTPSSSLPFSLFRRKRKTYPIASVKEIEQELVDILDRFGRLDNDPYTRDVDHTSTHEYNKRYLVFVIDELDKLVPRGFKSVWDKEREDPTDDAVPGAMQPGIGPKGSDLYRERQEAVATLFANLKHFLNIAQAKFIFIGGHDMYEGIQADTSDRDPFFGSIFNQIIYVPTLFKEEQLSHGSPVRGLATTVERFVSESLLPLTAILRAREDEELITLRHVQDLLCSCANASMRDALQIQQALQHFCIYLTFRSNGSTKKLVQLFERSVIQLEEHQIQRMLKPRRNNDINPSLAMCTDGDVTPGLYLRLSPTDQHAHGLLTYIYRPFLTDHSRLFSQLNDKNLVSFTYLLDHLFKYHSTAFSFFHLQLTPEVIAVDKIPDYHKFMDDTIQRLSASSIRQVDNGVFGFQFYTKLYNEIAVLTKISDLDSAALNFSLDESLPVKQHFYRRLHQALQNDKNRDSGGKGHSPMALSSIHHTLGDLHFYDQQLDDALAQYRLATHLLEEEVKTCLRSDPDRESRPQRDNFNQYVKIKLKEILCLEKMKIFEVALAVSSQLTQDIISYVTQWRRLVAQDIGNWRLLTLSLVHRLTLLDKTSRKGIRQEDVSPLVSYLEEIRTALKLRSSAPVPLEAALHEHLGTVLFYSRRGLPGNPNLALNALSAEEAYARGLRIALWNKRQALLLTHRVWDEIDSLDEFDKPRALAVAGLLSKYSDTLIANRAFGPMQPGSGAARATFGTVDVSLVVGHAEIGDIAAHILATAKAYLACDSQFQAIFQIKKLLHLFIERTHSSSSAGLPWEAIDGLCDWAVATVHAYNGRIDIIQMAKAREHLRAQSQIPDPELARLVSYSSDVREIEVLRNELLLKARLINGREVDQCYGGELSEATSTFTRMRTLMLCIRANWDMLDQSIKQQFTPGAKRPIGEIARLSLKGINQDALAPVVRDALVSCFMLLDAVHLYGTGFVANNTVLGKVHAHLADWCIILGAMNQDQKSSINRQLKDLLGVRYTVRIDPVMFYTKALAHFRRAVSMHGRGKHYRRVMNDMYMIEDDYKDNFYHFCCAMERMTVDDPGQWGSNARIVRLRLIVQALNLKRHNRKKPPSARKRSNPTALRYT